MFVRKCYHSESELNNEKCVSNIFMNFILHSVQFQHSHCLLFFFFFYITVHFSASLPVLCAFLTIHILYVIVQLIQETDAMTFFLTVLLT